MSLILDALNKAQHERQEQRQPVPQLSTVHHTPPLVDAALRLNMNPRWRLFALAMLAIIALVTLGWFSLVDSTPNVPESLVESAIPLISNRAQPLISNREQPQALAAGDEDTREVAVETNKPPEAAPVSVDASMPIQRPSAKPRADVTNLYQAAHSHANQAERLPVAESVRPVSPPDLPAVENNNPVQIPVIMPAPVKPEPVNSLSSRTDLPYMQELSWNTQQKLPSILYSGHQYSEESGTRKVEINGATYREGASVSTELVLEEIMSDGIILRFQAQSFKLQALNSWVNF